MTWFSKLVAAYRYRGRHRGVYDRAIGEKKPVAVDPIYLGSVLWDAKWYGMVSDSEEPGMMTATFEVAPEGGLCSIPLPDLPYAWEPQVHYTTKGGGLTVQVMPIVPDGPPLEFGKDWFLGERTTVEDWYGPMDFGVPPGLAECGPYHYKEWFHDEND